MNRETKLRIDKQRHSYREVATVDGRGYHDSSDPGNEKDAELGMAYLSQARGLGFADAYEVQNQIFTLGLFSLIPKSYRGNFEKDVQTWESRRTSSSPPPFLLQPPLSIADRRKLLEPYLAKRREAPAEAQASASSATAR